MTPLAHAQHIQQNVAKIVQVIAADQRDSQIDIAVFCESIANVNRALAAFQAAAVPPEPPHGALSAEQVEAVTRIYCSDPFGDDMDRAFREASVDRALATEKDIEMIERSAEYDDRCYKCGALCDPNYDMCDEHRQAEAEAYAELWQENNSYYGEAYTSNRDRQLADYAASR